LPITGGASNRTCFNARRSCTLKPLSAIMTSPGFNFYKATLFSDFLITDTPTVQVWHKIYMRHRWHWYKQLKCIPVFVATKCWPLASDPARLFNIKFNTINYSSQVLNST
jgi:hypothetical protein